MTPQEFDKMVAPFLETLEDYCNERWDSTREQAEDILVRFRNHIFAEDIAKEARRQQYLELRQEFETELKPKRVVKYMADCYPIVAEEPLE